ncbi:MAG: 3D domain-containing protein [Planctomycetota bacterium]
MKGIIITVAILAVILGPGWYLINLNAERNAQAAPKYAWKPVQARVTHYSCNEKAERRWKGKTSLNKSARNNDGVAVDPRIIPYGSVIHIPGIGTRVADDTGGKCRQYGRNNQVLVDVRWNDKTRQEMLDMGSEWQTVYILQKVSND